MLRPQRTGARGTRKRTVDREEITVVGRLPAVEEQFADIARQAEHRHQRKVAWGARLGELREALSRVDGLRRRGPDPT